MSEKCILVVKCFKNLVFSKLEDHIRSFELVFFTTQGRWKQSIFVFTINLDYEKFL